MKINDKFYVKPIILIVDNDTDGNKALKNKDHCYNENDYHDLFTYGSFTDLKNVYYIKPKVADGDLESFLKNAYNDQYISVPDKNNKTKDGQKSKVTSARDLRINNDTDIGGLDKIFDVISIIQDIHFTKCKQPVGEIKLNS